jgi:predicted nuclease with TOPRIM domain
VDQLEKLNDSDAKLLHHRIDAIEQSARNANAIIKHNEEIKSLNTKVSALQEFQKVLVHQNQNLQFRLNELCLLLTDIDRYP